MFHDGDDYDITTMKQNIHYTYLYYETQDVIFW